MRVRLSLQGDVERHFCRTVSATDAVALRTPSSDEVCGTGWARPCAEGVLCTRSGQLGADREGDGSSAGRELQLGEDLGNMAGHGA